jgi:hypothetical protein
MEILPELRRDVKLLVSLRSYREAFEEIIYSGNWPAEGTLLVIIWLGDILLLSVISLGVGLWGSEIVLVMGCFWSIDKDIS